MPSFVLLSDLGVYINLDHVVQIYRGPVSRNAVRRPMDPPLPLVTWLTLVAGDPLHTQMTPEQIFAAAAHPMDSLPVQSSEVNPKEAGPLPPAVLRETPH